VSTGLARLLIVISLLAAGLSLGGCKDKGASDAPPHRVTIAGHSWQVEVADTAAKQERGLSGRKSLDDDKGMLFILPDVKIQTFWMPDCFISLDIAFIGPDRRVISVQTMYKEPGVDRDHLKRYYSGAPAQYALEVPAGVMVHAGIKAGDPVEFSSNISLPAKGDSSP
jgi:uncharacterized membrane protein (UPF0127 family)